MLKSEIEAAIAYVKEQISKFTELLDTATQDKKDYEEAAGKLSKKASEIKDGLNTTLSTIEGKLSRVNQNSRFPSMYREKAKKLLINSDSDAAFSATSNAATAAADLAEKLQKEIKKYTSKIEALERDVKSLLQQLWEAI